MTRPASVSSLGSEFDEFLFAPIGEDGNGMLLSVLSALARLGLDPWQEATDLAGLPGETATRRLASLIAALPAGPSAHRDSGTIAAQLIPLLPGKARSQIPSRGAPHGGVVPTNSWAVFYMIFMILMLGAQSVLASRQPPSQIDDARATAIGTVSPQISPPNPGR